MAINLTKGQTIDLRKDANDLDQITVGLGWKTKEKKQGMLGALFGKKDDVEFDLDAIAFIIDDQGKIRNLGNERLGLVGSDVVFYNNLKHPSGLVYHTGDERKGGTGAQDDEQIVVKLNSLPLQYARILFLVAIYQGNQRKQHFGQVSDAYIRAVDGKGKEMARYPLSSEAAYVGNSSMVFGEVYRRDGGWKFRAIGEAHHHDSFIPLLKKYIS
jgi:stress response protein SCP2